MAFNPENGNFSDARIVSDEKSNGKKVEYDNLGYMSWEVIGPKGETLAGPDGKPVLASFSDIRLSNPKSEKHDFYCRGLARLIEMAEQAGGKTSFTLRVDVKVAQKKQEPKEMMSTEDMMKLIGITAAA